ncbi:MAG: response regulator transcription factor [Bacteroidia bacterium]|nr:response regulator transcription factor [Bacteroidia bacterium]
MCAKILIIDDEPDMRSLLKRALIANNYQVEEAENLQQGFEMYKRTMPDIIMLDVNLPDGTGTSHVSKFKNDTNVVLLMSADNDQLQYTFSELGAGGFIKKPFLLSELLVIINKHAGVKPG